MDTLGIDDEDAHAVGVAVEDASSVTFPDAEVCTTVGDLFAMVQRLLPSDG